MTTIIHDNNQTALQQYPDNHFHSMVTDPPYGLGKEPDVVEVMTDWLAHGYHEVKNTGGFMGKEWDKFVPQPVFWKQAFRVLHPGAHALVACGTRTVDWMMLALRFAGFEIRDVITWHYGSGFPKSLDISKAIDKEAGAGREIVGEKNNKSRGNAIHKGGLNSETSFDPITAPATDAAKQWDGYGTALKPATEFWILARKPLSEKTIAQNVIKWGTGAINIDDSRISFESDADFQSATFGRGTDIMGGNYVGAVHSSGKENIEANPQGRWPANLILSHHPDCECVGTEQVNSSPGGYERKAQSTFVSKENQQNNNGYGKENIEKWDCVDDCPVKMMNEQSGILTTGAMRRPYEYTNSGFAFGKPTGATKTIHNANSGYASRFFYCAKASRAERNAGLEDGGMVNDHPTVKPIKLMQHLVKMITPPGGTVLDPFAGSGTTGCACVLENFDAILIDEVEKNCRIAELRIAYWKKQLSPQIKMNLQ